MAYFILVSLVPIREHSRTVDFDKLRNEIRRFTVEFSILRNSKIRFDLNSNHWIFKWALFEKVLLIFYYICHCFDTRKMFPWHNKCFWNAPNNYFLMSNGRTTSISFLPLRSFDPYWHTNHLFIYLDRYKWNGTKPTTLPFRVVGSLTHYRK